MFHGGGGEIGREEMREREHGKILTIIRITNMGAHRTFVSTFYMF